jgi:hypothetical protein
MQHARPSRLRRAVAFAALAGMLGAGSLTLTQCTMVGDNISGVELERGRPTTCVKRCNDLFDFLYTSEQKRHQAQNEICQALPVAEQQACHATEVATHEANKASLTQGKTDCQNSCHRQGSGTAG